MPPPMPRKPNLEMRIAMLQAKAGQTPTLGVARYLRQKAVKGARGGKAGKGGGSAGEPSQAQAAQLEALVAERVGRKRHHALKLLRQAVRKARAFALRKLVRKLKEETDEAGRVRCAARMGALKALSAEWLTSRALQRAGLAELAGAEGLGKEQPLAGTAAELTQAAELVIGAAAVKSALAPLTDGPATARPTVPREPLPLPQPAAGARVRDVMEGSRAMLKAAVAPEWCAGSRAADATGSEE
eukprot:CAMPEP_0180025838 /NCGR_PEP_ID=MMETSP0984-20121128/24862_1 /TAXON_ID=483367 /ORGANISM="non described non described, Strain CCMP 2436" /LENGTH=242 /DNA_ID=CAMNT_0021950483 /DNA_START=8 /DNA_END=733 /DNA_ORIENTATION=+